jgi:hypothetical protein
MTKSCYAIQWHRHRTLGIKPQPAYAVVRINDGAAKIVSWHETAPAAEAWIYARGWARYREADLPMRSACAS